MWTKVLILTVFIQILSGIDGESIKPRNKNARVVIIGAGLAGMSALSELLDKGFQNVTLLEATGRIGGMIKTSRFGPNFLDVGAHWVHGEGGNIIYEMVNKHGVLEASPPSWLGFGGREGNYYTSNGQIRRDHGVLADLTRQLAGETSVTNPTGSVGNFYTDKYREALRGIRYRHISRSTADEFLRYWENIENVNYGSDSWFYSALSAFYHFEDTDGFTDLNWKDNGFQTVFDFITKKRPDPSQDLKAEQKVLRRKVVTNIQWSQNARELIRVQCSDGSVYEADHVITTVSLGVLKHDYKTLFTPELPRAKQLAIEGLGFGSMNKIFLEFERPFWPSDWSGFGMVWTQEDYDKLKVSNISWVRTMPGFWRISYQPNVLFAFTFGETARIIEDLPHSEVEAGVAYLLDKFLTPHFNHTRPIKTIITKWTKLPHFRGSYSFRSLTTDAFGVDATDLASPLTDRTRRIPRIQFAGEATSSGFYSTAHGAVESGYREAKRLIDLYK